MGKSISEETAFLSGGQAIASASCFQHGQDGPVPGNSAMSEPVLKPHSLMPWETLSFSSKPPVMD